MDAQAQITKMSSKGQIVIPEEIRHDLHLQTGSLFVVFGRKDADSILLKKLELPKAAGGRLVTIDELLSSNPKGSNVILVV